MTQQELNFGKPVFSFDSRFISKWFSRVFDDETKFPLIFIFKEKHENRYFVCKSHEEILSMFFHVFNERFESGDWYFNDEHDKIYDEDEAKAINESDDTMWALDFLERHRDHEYEGYTWTNPETF